MTPTAAEVRLADFRSRHPLSSYLLAVHASLPAAVNPELLHHVRDNFLLDGEPDERVALTADGEVAMARLLLSGMFRQIDDELFEMDRELRVLLLRELQMLDDGRRLTEVATLLERYTLESAVWQERPELQWAQRICARVANDPEAVEEWLKTGETQGGAGGLGERWFAATRRRLASQRDRPAIEPEPPRPTGPDWEAMGDAIVRVVSTSRESVACRILSGGLYVTVAYEITSPVRLVAPARGKLGRRSIAAASVDVDRDIALVWEPTASPPETTIPLGTTTSGPREIDVTVLGPGSRERARARLGGMGDLGSRRLLIDRSFGPIAAGSVVVNDGGEIVGILAEQMENSTLAVPVEEIVLAMTSALGILAPPFTVADGELLLRVAATTKRLGRAWGVVAGYAEFAMAAGEGHGNLSLFARSLLMLSNAQLHTGLADEAEANRDRAMAIIRTLSEQERTVLIETYDRLDQDLAEADVVSALADTGPPPETPTWLPDELAELAMRFDAASGLAEGPERTSAKQTVLDECRAAASRMSKDPMAERVPRELAESPSPGQRLIAVVFLQAHPDPTMLSWLAQRVSPIEEMPYVAYQAAVALRSAAAYVPLDQLIHVEVAVEDALALVATHRPSDRATVLDLARELVQQRREEAGATSPDDARVTSWKKWKNPNVLRVRFLNGSREHHEAIIALATQWTTGTGVRFEFLPPGSTAEAAIRIILTEGQASWAYLGLDALHIETTEPTMSIDTSTSVDGDWFRNQVLKVFGHALGLLSEHQQPNAHLPWDRDAVYRYFTGPPNNWTREVIDANLLQRYALSGPPEYRPFDPESVMLNSMPAELFHGAFEIPLNSELSRSDREFIARLYPAPTRTPPEDQPPPHQIGVYVPRALVASGGMGTSWWAEHIPLPSRIDLLFLNGPLVERAATRGRVVRKVTAAAKVVHPALVGIRDVLSTPDGVDVVATEHPERQPTLRDVLLERSRLPAWEVITFATSVAGALDALHAAGLTHDSVSPDAILTGDGPVRLMIVAAGVGLPEATPAYAAPEHRSGGAVGPWSDLYSLAAVMHECLTGAPSGRGELPAATPGPLAELIDRALLRIPAERPQSAEQFLAALVVAGEYMES